MPINFPDSLQANSTTFFLVDEGQLRGTARSITSFSNGALATAFPNNARVKVGSLAIATDTNVVYVCTNVANYNLTTGWTSISGTTLSAGQLMSLASNQVSFVGGSITGGNIIVGTSSGNQFTFRGNDSTTPTLTLAGQSSSGWAKLFFNPHTGLGSYIDLHNGSLFFQNSGVSAIEFNSSGNALFYNSVSIGSTSSTITAILDVEQTGNSKSNLRLVGINSGDNAKLDFAPSGAGESFINATSGKFYFQTGGVGTTYYDSTQWFFTLATAIQPSLSASGTALTINPTYASSSNGILIGGSSANATTRGLSITTTLTGATSNAVSITSSVTSVSALGRVVNISPTLVASANSDVLQTYFLNPTFTNSTFSNVKNYSIYSNNGAIYFDAGTQVGSNDGGVTQNTPYPFFYLNGNWSNISPITPAFGQGMILNFTTTGGSSPTNTSNLFQVIYNSVSLFSITLSALNLGDLSPGGSLTINTPSTTTFSMSGSASTFAINLGNNRRLNLSSSSSQNTGFTIHNLSHSHVGGTGSPNTGSFTNLLLQDTFTFTGTTGSPIARSLYINPTYTASATSTYRAIEVTNGNIGFNTNSSNSLFFVGGLNNNSSLATLILSRKTNLAQLNFQTLATPITSQVLGDIWFESGGNNLQMYINDGGSNLTTMNFLTYFDTANFTTGTGTPTTYYGGNNSSTNKDTYITAPDLWIEFNFNGAPYIIPCYIPI